MEKIILSIIAAFLILGTSSALAQTPQNLSQPKYNEELAKKLDADQYGMKNYVLCILKTGPKDAEFKGKERDDLFAAHLTNIRRLSAEGKLALAGPFGKNNEHFRGLFIFNVKTVEEAKLLVETDPTVKAGVLVPDLVPWYGTAALMEVTRIHNSIMKENP